MASLRLNIPVIFVSGGPMEAGKTKLSDKIIKLDLVDAMIQGANPNVSDADSEQIERSACPTCGSCSGMFTANSMNCLTEALGLSQPGNGSLLATHADRRELFLNAGRRIVELTKRLRKRDEPHCTQHRQQSGFENAMTLDIARAARPTPFLHLCSRAEGGSIRIDRYRRRHVRRTAPVKVAPSTPKYHMEDVHRAGGVLAIMGELDRAKPAEPRRQKHPWLNDGTLNQYDTSDQDEAVKKMFRAGPAGIRTTQAFSQDCRWDTLDDDRAEGCIRSLENAFSLEGGLAVLYGNIAEAGSIVKTAGVDKSNLTFRGPAKVYESQDDAVSAILVAKSFQATSCYPLRRAKGRAGMQECCIHTYLKSMGSAKSVR